MNCTEFLKILDDVIDESIAAETRAEIELTCTSAGIAKWSSNTTRKTIEIYRSHEIYELPAEVSERLHAAIMARCK